MNGSGQDAGHAETGKDQQQGEGKPNRGKGKQVEDRCPDPTANDCGRYHRRGNGQAVPGGKGLAIPGELVQGRVLVDRTEHGHGKRDAGGGGDRHPKRETAEELEQRNRDDTAADSQEAAQEAHGHADATEQPRSPTRRVARRGTAPTTLDGGAEAADAAAEADDEAEEAAEEAPDDASEGSDTHGERRVESLQRAATVRGAGEVASLVLVKWASLPQATPSPNAAAGLGLAR